VQPRTQLPNTSNQPHPAAVTSFTSAMHKAKQPSSTLQPLTQRLESQLLRL
jgi:hypothetical protein